MTKTALTIAGSDPSGGAGIQADLKVFTLYGVYGLAVPAALTAQNTVAAFAVKAVPPDFIRAQLEAVFADIEIGAVKTGMLLTADAVDVVADVMAKYGAANLVIDPVTISSSGKRLLKKDAADALATQLFPLATVVTPNRDEAEYYSGIKIESRRDAEKAARIIKKMGPANIIIKGGHMPGDATDLLFDGRE
ncbi:MAG TPA: bifunctional hydroxymethylpyrimidine kinase/phosphomethylpyrimidine kinase, partial [Nitrospirota bacterium]